MCAATLFWLCAGDAPVAASSNDIWSNVRSNSRYSPLESPETRVRQTLLVSRNGPSCLRAALVIHRANVRVKLRCYVLHILI